MVWQHLTAFGNAASEAWQLRARIQRLDQSSLTLNFELLAPAAELIWPVAAPASNRCDELWHSTCLEVFIAKPGDANYWEVNLSPRGDWNVYQLDDYRKGLRPETSIGSIPIRSTSEPDRHQLQATLALPQPLIDVNRLQANLCAVVESANGSNSYWALSHLGKEADFHARDGFVLEI